MEKTNGFQYQGFCGKCGAKRIDNQLGLEKTPEEFIENCVKWAREIWRVLRKDGTFWLNLGDSYVGGNKSGKRGASSFAMDAPASWGNRSQSTEINMNVSGLKSKDLCGMPWKVVFALQADGWWLRSAMPWVKRSAMPESCTDRPASALEYMFLLTKSSKYFFDMENIKIRANILNQRSNGVNATEADGNMGGNKRTDFEKNRHTVTSRNFRNTDLFYQSLEEPYGAIFAGEEMVGLDVNPYSYKEAHFATFPPKLVEPCIKAGTSEKGACPECGSPWERVVEPTKEYRKHLNGKGFGSKDWVEKGNGDIKSQNYPSLTASYKTIGWQPTCKCGHKEEPVPCIVLDNFGGSGTTKNVADRLGRRGVMCELKMEYIEMAKKRCLKLPDLFLNAED